MTTVRDSLAAAARQTIQSSVYAGDQAADWWSDLAGLIAAAQVPVVSRAEKAAFDRIAVGLERELALHAFGLEACGLAAALDYVRRAERD